MPVQTDRAEVELHSRNMHAVPGEPFTVALRLRPEPGWHTYWRNPGDSGLPTRIDWQLPEGVTAGAIQWPAPERHSLADIVNYGYGAQTMHLVPFDLSADWPAGRRIDITAQAHWLICADICVPESAQLSLSIPTAVAPAKADPIWAPDFETAEARLPIDVDWQAAQQRDGNTLRLQLQLPPDAPIADDRRLALYPVDDTLVHHSANQELHRLGDTLWLAQAAHARAADTAPSISEWILVANDGDEARRAWSIRASAGDVPPVPAAAVALTSERAATPPLAQTPGATGLAWILLGALLGGLLLNLMPCVFPVLAIKALGVLQAQAHSRANQRRHALAYTAGVVLSCVAAAGLLLALRAGGQALGWGFQLQSPVFVGVLVYVFFALGLSLSGVFTLGTRIMGLGQGLTEQRGAGGSFATGVLAVVVASPCTAPFMGAALGFAVTQSAATALLIFATLGLGLALPFLLIGFVPAAARALPKPGAWMEGFKQLMAFPLYLSVAWLLWVLTRQAGSEAMLAVAVGMVLVAFAAWLWHREGWMPRLLRTAALLGALGLAALPAMQPSEEVDAPSAAAFDGTDTNHTDRWSPARVSALREQGDTIFVNFTADWCITCLANERLVLTDRTIQDAFARPDVHYLKADWTRADPRITETLAEFGRNGVPLYLVYRDGGEATVMPQILGVDSLRRALIE